MVSFHRNMRWRELQRRAGAIGVMVGVVAYLPAIVAAQCIDHSDYTAVTEAMALHAFTWL
jgi:hypothetical protein